MAAGGRCPPRPRDQRAQADRRHAAGDGQQPGARASTASRANPADRPAERTDRCTGRPPDPLPAVFRMIASAAALTQAQRAAVDHGAGPLLIVAGAGTGKTRVLVERYRRLRLEGGAAEQILLLTFPEKAAREGLDPGEQEDYLPARERFVLPHPAFAP